MGVFYDLLIKQQPLRKSYTFSEIMKFNPYHGKDGRFSSANSATSFTYQPGKSVAHDTAIARAKSDHDWSGTVKENANIIRGKLSNNLNKIEVEKFNISKVMKETGCDRETAEKSGKLAEKIFNKSSQEEKAISSDVISAASENGGKMFGLDYRLKQSTSMARKIVSDQQEALSNGKKGATLEDAAANVKDSVRYTAVFETKDFASGYRNVKSSLESKGYDLVRTKNFFNDYENNERVQIKSVQSVFKSPNGTMFEFQFQTPESQGAKEISHPMYEKSRAGTTSKAERNQLERAMRKAYESVPTTKEIQGIEKL